MIPPPGRTVCGLRSSRVTGGTSTVAGSRANTSALEAASSRRTMSNGATHRPDRRRTGSSGLSAGSAPTNPRRRSRSRPRRWPLSPDSPPRPTPRPLIQHRHRRPIAARLPPAQHPFPQRHPVAIPGRSGERSPRSWRRVEDQRRIGMRISRVEVDHWWNTSAMAPGLAPAQVRIVPPVLPDMPRHPGGLQRSRASATPSASSAGTPVGEVSDHQLLSDHPAVKCPVVRAVVPHPDMQIG